jgi:nicotinate phosphoribosyltransferase
MGKSLLGVRIDSGDLAYLSRESRRMLDEAGFPEVKIIASNDLDEYVINSICDEGGKVDIYGVGTRLATCAGEGGGALGGVYKLVKADDLPKLKVTSDIAKATLPDRKRLIRAVDPDGAFIQDIICLADEDIKPGDTVYDPANPMQHVDIPKNAVFRDIRSVMMEGGRRTAERRETLDEMADRTASQLKRLPQGCLRFINPHRYKVSISVGLCDLRLLLTGEVQRGYL